MGEGEEKEEKGYGISSSKSPLKSHSHRISELVELLPKLRKLRSRGERVT